MPRLLWALVASCLVAAAWFLATILGATRLDYEIPGAPAGAMVFLALNLYFLVTAIRRIRSARYAADRRASVRLTVSLSGRLDGTPCEIVDLSLTGASVVVSRAPRVVSGTVRLELDFPGETVELRAAIPRREAMEKGAMSVGLEFAPGQRPAISQIALALLSSEAAPRSGRQRMPETRAA